MESVYKKSGKGLYYLFIGQIVSLFALIPILGIIALLAGTGLSIYGVYTLTQADTNYQTAFILTIANFVVSLISAVIFRSGFMNSVFRMLSTILGFLVVYFICTTTGTLLSGIDNKLVDKSNQLWKLYLICTVVSIVCTLLSVIPIINILAGLVVFVIAIVQTVAAIMYLVFLWSSQKTLQAY